MPSLVIQRLTLVAVSSLALTALLGCAETDTPITPEAELAAAAENTPSVTFTLVGRRLLGSSAPAAAASTEVLSNGSFANGASGWKTSTRRKPIVDLKSGEALGEMIGAPLGSAGPAPSGTQTVARFCGYPYNILWRDANGELQGNSGICSDKLEPETDITIPASGAKLGGWVYGNFGCTEGVKLEVFFIPRGSAPKIPTAKLTPADLTNQQWSFREYTLPAEAAGQTYRMIIWAQTNPLIPCTDETPQKLRDTWFLVTDISLKSL